MPERDHGTVAGGPHTAGADHPDVIRARTELEHASLSYYLTAADPSATRSDLTSAVDWLEHAGKALAAARTGRQAEAEHEAEMEP